MAAGDEALSYQAEAGQEKIDFLQNSDIVLDSNSIAYSLEKEEPSFAGQISYSPTPFPNTPITSNNSTDWNPRLLPGYFARLSGPDSNLPGPRLPILRKSHSSQITFFKKIFKYFCLIEIVLKSLAQH